MPIPVPTSTVRDPLPRRWFWVVMAGLLAVIAVSTYFNRLSLGATEARKFRREMPADQISEISIEPSNVLSLTDHVIVIRDRAKIAQIAELFRRMAPVSPNHPSATWLAIIRFRLPDRQFGGQIEMTRNQGGLFWLSSKIPGGWNYGTFRNDALGPLFERLVAEKKSRK